jgi:undecaprenyl diphosphate synthase
MEHEEVVAEQVVQRLEGIRLPRHIAVVMDGNGRWAQQRGQPRRAGHQAGIRGVRSIVELCGRLQIQALTLYAFSSENWKRPAGEIRVLMELFRSTLDRELDRLQQNNVRLRFIGERQRLESPLQRRLSEAERATAENDGLNLVIATSYGGRWEVTEASRRLARAAAQDELDPEQITESRFQSALAVPDLPDPDLFIRTGGERRLSNFLLWQLAYTELYFTDTLWPDFGAQDLACAVEDFAERERRFGNVNSPGDAVLNRDA